MEFTPGMKQFVVNLKQFNDAEKIKEGQNANWAIKRTAEGLGIGEATVRRVMAEYNKNKQNIPNKPKKSRGRPDFSIPGKIQPIVRKFIRSQNLLGKFVSLELVSEHLSQIDSDYVFPITTLWRALNRWGFTYGVGKRRSALKEKDYVILARRRYLRQKLSNRKSDGTFVRPEVYLDETYVNKNHSNQFTWFSEDDGSSVNKPSGKGERLIIINAITRKGWIEYAELVFESKKRTGDYHGQMNWDNFSFMVYEKIVAQYSR